MCHVHNVWEIEENLDVNLFRVSLTQWLCKVVQGSIEFDRSSILYAARNAFFFTIDGYTFVH